MKKGVYNASVKFLFLILFLFVSGCSLKVKNLNSQGRTIVCFGDSITYGAGSSKGKDYPSILSDMIKNDYAKKNLFSKLKVINAGLSGDTTEGALKRIDKDVLSKDPYLVVIEFGGNDFLKGIPLEETMNNLKKIIVRIQKYGAIAAVCDTTVSYFMRGYRGHFAKIARDNKAIFIPAVLEGIFNSPKLKSDYIHPDDEGYRIIAQKIYRTIKPYMH